MRFPVVIRHRQGKAKIYAPGKNFDYYRLSFMVAGKSQMRSFRQYSDAKTQAERLVRETSQGSQPASLSASQSQDAVTALERLTNLSSVHRTQILPGVRRIGVCIYGRQGACRYRFMLLSRFCFCWSGSVVEFSHFVAASGSVRSQLRATFWMALLRC